MKDEITWIYRKVVFRILVARYLLFKSLPSAPQTNPEPEIGDSMKFETALNGKIRVCGEEFTEVRDLLIDSDPNINVFRLKIDGHSFSDPEEINDFPQTAGRSSETYTDTADLTINRPILIFYMTESTSSNIACFIYRFYRFRTLLQIYGLQPQEVTVLLWDPETELVTDPDLRYPAFREFCERMFGGIERISSTSPPKILLKRALFYIDKSELKSPSQRASFRIVKSDLGSALKRALFHFDRSFQKILLNRLRIRILINLGVFDFAFLSHPSVPAIKNWVAKAFQLEAKTKTRKVKKIVFIDRQLVRPNKPGWSLENRRRRIINMDELCDTIQARYPTLSFVRARLELLPIAEQVALLAEADIVIGTHGAGTVFAAHIVPENAGIIELLPANLSLLHAFFTVSEICRLRNVHYDLRFQCRKKRRISKNYKEKYGPFEPEEIANYYPPKAIIQKIAAITHRIEKNMA